MTQVVKVIYPCGDKSKLAFGIMFEYESDEWSIASRRSFSYDEEGQVEALEYGRELSTKYNLPLDISNLDINNGHDYLD